MAALPDLAAPAELDAVLEATITDPMRLAEVSNMEAVRNFWRAAVEDAAAAHGEGLRGDWSNLFQCTRATNELYDLAAIFEDAATSEAIEALVVKTYSMLLSEAAEDWTLQQGTTEAAAYTPEMYLPRPWSLVAKFVAKSFVFAPHCVA